MTSEIKTCKNCATNFEITLEDFDFYRKIAVPAPTFCPECRLKRRLAQRNERSLYKRKCDLCGESIISMYSPNKPFKVYCPKCWHGDGWDTLAYGRDYDPSRSFFDQLKELQLAVPHLSLFQENAVNSPWINYETDDKNCYLNFGGHFNEDSAYNQYNLKSKDCIDNFWLMKSEYGYENILCENAYKNSHSVLCYDCRDTTASFDCRNCSNIVGCTGLRHKQYCLFNEQVSKEEYEKFMKENFNGSYEKLQALLKRCNEFWKTQPQRASFIEKSVNARGHLIFESKNVSDALSVDKTEDSRFVLYTLETKDFYDVTSVWKSELCYEFLGGMGSNSAMCMTAAIDSSRVAYSHMLWNCNDCFGCMNMKKKQYCILNKQYSPEEYKRQLSKVKSHMLSTGEYGEFFPMSFSPYAYRETIAYEWFPETDEPEIEGTMYEFSDYAIPDNIHDVRDDILEKVLKCEKSGKAYRIIPMELAFYRRFSIPIPHLAPFERHHQRLKFISDHRKLIPRTCGSCHNTTESVYSEAEFPIIYCNECYMQKL